MQKSGLDNIIPSLFNIDIEEVMAIGIDLNHVYLLDSIDKGLNINKNAKINGWLQTLVRHGYLDNNHIISDTAKVLLTDLRTGKKNIAKERLAVVEQQMDGFDLWWEAYPKNDVFEYKGKKFSGGRGLRIKKPECKKKFEAIVFSGKFTAQELVDALVYEVNQKKEESLKSGVNKLSYMKATEAYLNSGMYENFIDVAKEKRWTQPTNSAGGTFRL